MATTADDTTLMRMFLHPLGFQSASLSPLLEAIGDAQIVLIGDGSHGTYEFYAHRANLTKRLLEEKGFSTISVEADWPDAFKVNRYIHSGETKDGPVKSAYDALSDFERFPKWMWKNEVMLPFIDYLRLHNEKAAREKSSRPVSFFGLDLYSLHRSAEEVIRYLEEVDLKGAAEARRKYNCFERFGEDTMRYAYETQFGLAKNCHKEVILNLKRLLTNRYKYIEEQYSYHHDPEEEQFMAEMNALVVKDAEEYYRTMLTEDELSWSLRDDYFARALVRISDHITGTTGKKAKIVVWAHNSHVGDARATDMGKRRGEINVGQRCREIFGANNVFNIGFLTNRGTVTAARQWDTPPLYQTMSPPIERSIERVFDESSTQDCYIIAHRINAAANNRSEKVEEHKDLTAFLNKPRYQRFIGVLYKRSTEIPSHYSVCNAADQFDAIAHLKKSRGIRPLDPEDTWEGPTKGDLDLTFPFGQ